MQEKIFTNINPKNFFKYYPLDNGNSGNLTQFNLHPPKMIGYFSVNEHRDFVADASQLKYLKMPRTHNVKFDLNDGIKDFRFKPDSVIREKMDFLLRFIVDNIDKCKAKNGYRCEKKALEPDIICSRGRLVQIMCPPNTAVTRWSLIVSKYKGNIYICQPDGDNEHALHIVYGFKFEQFMLSGKFACVDLKYHLKRCTKNFQFFPSSIFVVENPLDDPITDVPVNESEEFYGVFKMRINDISLLYNAEMDGLDSPVEIDLSTADLEKLRFVELKTTLYSAKGLKLCRWWAHSFLANISTITVGHRNEKGIVTKISNLSVLPKWKQVIL